MISIVACCHGVELCAHAARAFRLQQCLWKRYSWGIYKWVWVCDLRLREPVYDIFVLRFQPKKQQFLVALPTP